MRSIAGGACTLARDFSTSRRSGGPIALALFIQVGGHPHRTGPIPPVKTAAFWVFVLLLSAGDEAELRRVREDLYEPSRACLDDCPH